MLGRLSTRLRTSVAAGLAALLLLAGGAWWLRGHMYDAQLAAAEADAREQARELSSGYKHGQQLVDSGSLPYVVLDSDGQVLTMGGPLTTQHLAGEPPATAPRLAPDNWQSVQRITIGPAGPAAANRYSGRTFTAMGSWSPLLRENDQAGQPMKPLVGPFTVYVLATPFAAEASLHTIDPVLMVGVPTAALLVALMAWAATRRALRPVEAIRAELAEIGEHRLDRRVPVPRSGDEIARMARTTNATLDRLERSAVQQQRFVADASHELRSPIAALRTNLEVSLAHPERTDWPAATREALTSVERLQQLTEDLLFLARGAHPETAGRQTVVDLSAVLRELADQYRPVVGARPALRVDAPEAVLVRGSRIRLHRLVRNLLDNARRHASAEVVLSARQTGRGCVLEVRDDGPGVPEQDRERIFEPFTRLDEARSRDAGGSGLGLAIAADIATRHGGTLRVAHAPRGARFVLELPSV
ncbi:cell wall metabolism sensor histidine kinase WalK [Streptomyces sp. FH025]|uniref:sensor histidine kinase n=1 Tax=Streptomyces sp. FH025 TaxID=2815937 RepID=UPI001A9F6638|nr:HAMP domain-containing sensor histidine kinase [Streptomyces sp. FH025]MBO1413689.1 HAMP domain-containing histidine kinase [Streptomyces sp. FH025]